MVTDAGVTMEPLTTVPGGVLIRVCFHGNRWCCAGRSVDGGEGLPPRCPDGGHDPDPQAGHQSREVSTTSPAPITNRPAPPSTLNAHHAMWSLIRSLHHFHI